MARGETGHVPANPLGAELDAMAAERAADWQRRRDAKAAVRAELKAARDVGLQRRHQTKLSRGAQPHHDGQEAG